VIARALDVAEDPLQPAPALKAFAARKIHRQAGRRQRVFHHQRPPQHHPVDAFGRGVPLHPRRRHVVMCKPRGVQPHLQLTCQARAAAGLGTGGLDHDGPVARGLGQSGVDRVDQRDRDIGRDLEDQVPLARLALEWDLVVGDEQPVEHHALRSGATHPHRIPDLIHPHAGRIQRRPEMQDRRPSGFLGDGAGHQDRAQGRARSEGLGRVDPVAALDLLGPAGAAHPVRPARGHHHDALGGNAAQQRFDDRFCGGLVPPAPGRDRDLMRVHREGKRRRAAAMRQTAQHIGKLCHRRPTTAEFDGHAGLDQTRVL
jgi:hypothetical protein